MPRTHHASGRGKPSAQDRGTAAGHELFAGQLGELARMLQAGGDTGLLLDEVVAAAVRLIPGVDECSISVVHQRRDVVSQSPSGELPVRVDAIQAEVGEGSCLDAVFEQTVRVSDLASEERWPRFARCEATLSSDSVAA